MCHNGNINRKAITSVSEDTAARKNAAPQQPISWAGPTYLRRSNAQEHMNHAQCFSWLVPLAKIDKIEAQRSLSIKIEQEQAAPAYLDLDSILAETASWKNTWH